MIPKHSRAVLNPFDLKWSMTCFANIRELALKPLKLLIVAGLLVTIREQSQNIFLLLVVPDAPRKYLSLNCRKTAREI